MTNEQITHTCTPRCDLKVIGIIRGTGESKRCEERIREVGPGVGSLTARRGLRTRPKTSRDGRKRRTEKKKLKTASKNKEVKRAESCQRVDDHR